MLLSVFALSAGMLAQNSFSKNPSATLPNSPTKTA